MNVNQKKRNLNDEKKDEKLKLVLLNNHKELT